MFAANRDWRSRLTRTKADTIFVLAAVIAIFVVVLIIFCLFALDHTPEHSSFGTLGSLLLGQENRQPSRIGTYRDFLSE